jgi:hypothetical protein
MPDRPPLKQAEDARRLRGRALLFLAMFALAACGKMASQLDAPDPDKQDTYPRTYPDPSTDPKP